MAALRNSGFLNSTPKSLPTPRLVIIRPRALTLGREGKYGKAVQALDSLGIRSHNDPVALIQRHVLPEETTNPPPSLSVTSPQVLASIQSFAKGTSPGS